MREHQRLFFFILVYVFFLLFYCTFFYFAALLLSANQKLPGQDQITGFDLLWIISIFFFAFFLKKKVILQVYSKWFMCISVCFLIALFENSARLTKGIVLSRAGTVRSVCLTQACCLPVSFPGLTPVCVQCRALLARSPHSLKDSVYTMFWTGFVV